MKKFKLFKNRTMVLLVAAIVLLFGSAIGSTRAALTYYSENYVAGIQTSSIDVSLVENGVSTDALLAGMLGENEKLVLGKSYTEEISVANTGSIDSYVRVVLTKSWKGPNGDDALVKDTTLDPEMIELNLLTGNGWFIDESASTEERTVLYYANVLSAGGVTPALSDTIKINPNIGKMVIQSVKEDENGTTITYVHEYDGYSFSIEAEVNAVQTHNAQTAIKSAWGIDVNVAEDGSLSLS